MIRSYADCVKCGARMSGPKWIQQHNTLKFHCTCGYSCEQPAQDANKVSNPFLQESFDKAKSAENAVMSYLDGRAQTADQKVEIIERLLDSWHCMPDLRLGQLLLCALDTHSDIFYLEDYDLIKTIENFVREKTNVTP